MAAEVNRPWLIINIIKMLKENSTLKLLYAVLELAISGMFNCCSANLMRSVAFSGIHVTR